jgi:hypothetical protein
VATPYGNREVPSAEDAAAVFARNGLASSRFRRTPEIPTDETRPDAGAEGLCGALSELGGLYLSFARFLRWRADLLPGSYIAHLRRLRFHCPPLPVSHVANAIRRELGPAAEEVAACLSPAPEWNTTFRTAYRSEYRCQPVIVEIAPGPITEESFEKFERGLSSLAHSELAGMVASPVISQFREYIRNGESLARERSFLEALRSSRSESRAQYPVPIRELCSPSILCWAPTAGHSASELIEKGDARTPVLIASAILEQFLSLSLLDADLDLEAMVVRNGRLHFCRLNNPVAVLPRAADTGLQYISSVLAGNEPRSAQTLLRLVISHPALQMERRLMEQFSAIEPELKIKMWFPPSAGAFESNWRSLAKIAPSRPLFLDCLHRNLLAAGYWNADAVEAGAPAKDAIAEAMWPAIGRLLRDRFDALSNVESLPEWALGSGMLMLSTIREINRQAEELREGDLSAGVESDESRLLTSKGGRNPHPMVLAALAALFLATLEWGGTAPAPWGLLLKSLAVVALAAMFWAVSKVG